MSSTVNNEGMTSVEKMVSEKLNKSKPNKVPFYIYYYF